MRDKHNKISESIETSLKNLGEIIDANTVIGKPFESGDGEVIIPMSKITFFSVSGGGKYGKVGLFKDGGDLPFSAGNGAVVSMKPCGFLVKKDGEYKVLPIAENSYEKLIDKTAEIIYNLKGDNNDQKI